MLVIEKVFPINKGSVICNLDIRIPQYNNLLIKRITVFNKNGHRWVSFPSESYEKDGKKKYFQYISFQDKGTQDNFQSALLKALDEHSGRNQQQNSQPQQQQQQAWSPASQSYADYSSGNLPF